MSEPRSSRRADHNVAAPGRRAGDAGRRKVDLVVALAVAFPAVAALGLAAVGDHDDPSVGSVPPVSTGLTAATLSCPQATTKHSEPLVVARAPKAAGGQVRVSAANRKGTLGPHGTVTATATRSASLRAAGPTILDASGAAAPGLVAGRREPQAGVACTTPAYDEWYVGMGGSATNDSVLVLSNPDAGQAVVDTELLGLKGPLEADALRGLVVPGHGVLTVDLAKKFPTRSTFSAHVMVSRGRVGVSVESRFDRLGGAAVVTDHLPAQDAAGSDLLLLGATVEGQSMYLTNPGEDQARATVRVLSKESIFTPTGTKPVVVPPQSVVRVPLTSVVPTSARKGMVGIVVESDQPLLAAARGMVDGDLAVVGASPTVTGPTAAVVPDGPTKLLLAGAIRAGVVNLTVSDASGRVLVRHKAVDIAADRGVSVALPKGAAVVTLDPRNTSVAASLVTTAHKAVSVVPVRDTVVRAEVPAIRPH